MKKSPSQASSKCNTTKTDEDSWLAANYFSETNSEKTTTKKRSISCFIITEGGPSTRNDATAETGTNEAQRASA